MGSSWQNTCCFCFCALSEGCIIQNGADGDEEAGSGNQPYPEYQVKIEGLYHKDHLHKRSYYASLWRPHARPGDSFGAVDFWEEMCLSNALCSVHTIA